MMDLSNVVEAPFEEIKAGDKILIKCEVYQVCSSGPHRLKIFLENHDFGVQKYSFGISNDQYVGKIEQPPKVGDRYKHEHGQPIRIIFIVRDYAVMEYENAELVPFVYRLDALKRIAKLPQLKSENS